MRILVTDDEDATRELLTELLQKSGHTVTSVRTGREAVAAVECGEFEVVFMDEEMPGMSGIEATREIHRQQVSGGRRPIIVGLSGNGTEADEKRCLVAGMDAFLAKPVRMGELFSLLAVLARHSQPSAPGEMQLVAQGSFSKNLAASLLRATGGNEKILRSLVKNFLADAPKKLSLLRRAVARQDAEALASIAHALKGSIGLFGAQEAVAAADNLQAMGREGAFDGAAKEFRALEDAFKSLRRELLTLKVNAAPARKRAARRRAPSRPRRKR
ncbi:MAG TPA: response regulator [Candidatus Acidoferrales bacterium]|nr:response regulator [Candidatus Acidoferrales bacterium]